MTLDVIMMVVITFTFYCDNLWKSVVYGSGELGDFLLLLCGHPTWVCKINIVHMDVVFTAQVKDSRHRMPFNS